VGIDRGTVKGLTDRQLILAAQAGDDLALEETLIRCRPLAHVRATSYFMRGGDDQDVTQEGMIGLFKAILDYDLTSEVPFWAFEQLCIKRQISSAITRSNAEKHRPLNQSLSLEVVDPARGRRQHRIGQRPRRFDVRSSRPLLDIERANLIMGTLRRDLSDLEKSVLHGYSEGYCYEAIAASMDRPTKTVDNAIQRIRRKVSTALHRWDRQAERTLGISAPHSACHTDAGCR
jgi:RNA polymerase sporulation-specific sigma factor